MGKLLKRRSEMIKDSDVNDKIDYLRNAGEKLQELKSDTRVLSDVKAKNASYADSLTGQDRDDFVRSFNMTKKVGIDKINRDFRMGRNSGISETRMTIGYDVNELRNYLMDVKVNNEWLPFNARAFEEIELLMRDKKISAYESSLPSLVDKTKTLIDDYSKESVQRGIMETVNNLKENAVTGFVNNHPLSKLEDKLGLREKLEPELKQSLTDKDLMSKFEDVHMNVFGSGSSEHLSSDKNHDLEMGD